MELTTNDILDVPVGTVTHVFTVTAPNKETGRSVTAVTNDDTGEEWELGDDWRILDADGAILGVVDVTNKHCYRFPDAYSSLGQCRAFSAFCSLSDTDIINATSIKVCKPPC